MGVSAPVPMSKWLWRRFNLHAFKMDTLLLPDDKLALLQATDLRRKWHSLDDQRVCVLCDRTITGRQIEVTREPGGTLTLHCPTKGCPSVPSDWFYQGNACSTSKPANVRMSEASIWTS
jgi:hypothetical protein